MSETLDLFKTALGLGEPWRVTRSDFDVAQGRLDLYLDFPAGRAFRVFGGGLRSGFLPGARHRGQDVAALGFLPVQGVPTRAGAADPLPRARGASGGGGLG